jgi:hypothetical protein
MTEERKLSTSDLAAAMDRREADVVKTERAAIAPEGTPAAIGDERPSPLFGDQELTGYRTRWSGIQTGFVDEPRRAVEEADALVAELMKRLAEVFANERRQVEAQWEQSDKVSTEDLRIAMRRYRSFFERLLSI